MRAWRLRNLFGLTLDEYDEMWNEQGGVCAICEEPQKNRKLAVDHDHDTGEVRGLLCTSCNLGIGNLKDSIDILESAINYLGKYQN